MPVVESAVKASIKKAFSDAGWADNGSASDTLAEAIWKAIETTITTATVTVSPDSHTGGIK